MTLRPARVIYGALWAIGLLAWLALPGVAVLFISQRAASVEIVEVKPIWVPISPATGEVSRLDSLALSWGGEPAIYAPMWGGVVQDVFLKPGDPVISGQPIATIDGIERIGWALSQPLYRPLGVGDSGPDARSANELLQAAGFDSGESDTFGHGSLAATRQYAANIGVPDAHRLDVFDPSWVVYLPHEESNLTSVLLQRSAPAPAAGSPILTLGEPLTSARLDQPARAGEELHIAGTPVTLDESQSSVAVADLPKVQELVAAGADKVGVSLTRHADGDWVIPASAVSASLSGEHCVIARSPASAPRVVRVSIQATGTGETIVHGDFSPEDQVRVGAFAELPACD